MAGDLGDADLTFFATAAKGAESLLTAELHALAADTGLAESTVSEERGGAAFTGPLALGYRACLWTRVAQRVLLQLATLPLDGAAEAFWGRLAEIDWAAHLAPDGTLAVDFGGLGSSVGVTNTLFGAQRTKDVIVDQFRERFGRRPSVDPAQPDVRVNVYVGRREALVSLDLSGESLHRRGYREPGRQGEAPLKETLAAAVLLRAGWPAIAAAGGSVVDPLCGSGTLPIEAALIAADVAPGLLRAPERWGFTGWLGHNADVWNELVAEAGERRDAALARLRATRAPATGTAAIGASATRTPTIGVSAIGPAATGTPARADDRTVPLAFGFDRDTRAVDLARADVARAGLEGLVTIERRDLAALVQPAGLADLARPGLGDPARASEHADPARPVELAGPTPGLVVANPPYGRRLGADASAARSPATGDDAAAGAAPDPALGALYALLGDRLKAEFSGWRAAILVNDLELGKRLGLRARRRTTS